MKRGPSYRSRAEKSRARIGVAIERLIELEKLTHPDGGEKTTIAKTPRAQEALHVLNGLIQDLAGWAIDHHVGLGLAGLMPADAEVDDHRHEAAGSTYFTMSGKADAPAARQVLINLFRADTGTFPPILAAQAATALEALNLGEVQALLDPVVSLREANAYSRDALESYAIEYVEFLVGTERQKVRP